MVEKVVLVDDDNAVQGTAPKHSVHDEETPLHRGFSTYVFNDDGKLLLQQRSEAKTTWPGFWSNSVCGHPEIEETVVEAARRRADDELNLTLTKLTVVLPEYRYEFSHENIKENELCPVLVAQPKSSISPNPDEVQATTWESWEDIVDYKDESTYTPWFLDEVDELQDTEKFNDWYDEVIM
jgi:isopentenyl-diphosphate delta-isomerase